MKIDSIDLSRGLALEFWPRATPEQQLLAAMLERAFLDACPEKAKALFSTRDQDNSGKQAHKSAISWFKSDSTKPFSFIWVCEYLNIESVKIRKMALENPKISSRFKWVG